jgi:ABC-type transport system involved in multi-copper enzyme maturation permease subunit
MKRISLVKGLILYSYHSAIGNIAIVSAICLVVGILLVITGDSRFLNIFISLGITLMSCSLMYCVQKDKSSKWNRYQLAMPVKRSDVIASQYLGHLIALLYAIIFTGTFSYISIVLHKDILTMFNENALSIIPLSIGASLVSCALFYPFVPALDANGGESLIFVCMLIACCINAFIYWLGHKAELPQGINAALCIVLSIVFFIISFIITIKIYAKKDF